MNLQCGEVSKCAKIWLSKSLYPVSRDKKFKNWNIAATIWICYNFQIQKRIVSAEIEYVLSRLKIEDFFKYLVYSDLPLEASSGST